MTKKKSPLCQDICEKPFFTGGEGRRIYQSGYKYCRICKVYILTKDLCCNCCGKRLRTTKHRSKNKSNNAY